MEENDVYNEFNINERNANEYEADPSVFLIKLAILLWVLCVF